MKYTCPAIFEELSAKDGGGYSVTFPDWGGATYGRTMEEDNELFHHMEG